MTTVFNPNELANAYTFGGSTIDGTITAIVPETSTLVMGGIALATFLRAPACGGGAAGTAAKSSIAVDRQTG